MRHWEQARRAAALLAALAAAAMTGTNGAGASSTLLAPCSSEPLTQPFLPWLDPAHYLLVPDCGLEARAEGWSPGGARVVSGNESYYVRSRADSRSLALPSGSSATTPWMCAGLAEPTLRLFALNSGSPLSTLKVEVLYEDVLGVTRVSPVALLVGTAGWRPTLPLPFLANVTSLRLLTDGATRVAFRLTPQGAASGWRVDDLYVDPYKGK